MNGHDAASNNTPTLGPRTFHNCEFRVLYRLTQPQQHQLKQSNQGSHTQAKIKILNKKNIREINA